MSDTAPPAHKLLALAAGFVIWTAAFVILYATLSVGCRFGWDGLYLFAGMTLQRGLLVLIFLVHVAGGIVLVACLRGGPPPRSGGDPSGAFLREVARYTAIAALGSTIFSFVAVFGLSAC